jgi:hypothetical protein
MQPLGLGVRDRALQLAAQAGHELLSHLPKPAAQSLWVSPPRSSSTQAKRRKDTKPVKQKDCTTNYTIENPHIAREQRRAW